MQKKLRISFIAAIIAALFLTVPSFAGNLDPEVAGLYIVLRNANVREGPGTEFAITDTKKAGAYVTVVASANDEWYELLSGEFMFKALLQKKDGSAQPAATPTPTAVKKAPKITPTPVAIVDPVAAAFRQAVTQCGNQCKFSTMEVDRESIPGTTTVRFMQNAPGLIASVEAFRKQSSWAVHHTLLAASTLATNVDYDAIAFEFDVPLVDAYGNDVEELGYAMMFERSTIERINYDALVMAETIYLADRLYIHPALQEE